jgi:hypothetical protein
LRSPPTESTRTQVLLAVVSHLVDGAQEDKLRAFLDAQPEALSIPFIGWLADMEAAAVGDEKQVRRRSGRGCAGTSRARLQGPAAAARGWPQS